MPLFVAPRRSVRHLRRRLVGCFLMLALAVSLVGISPVVMAAELRIAVSANFVETLKRLVDQYSEQEPEFSAAISSGSSGKHFAQIRQGAPFDLFFSADDLRTAELVESGHGVADSRFAYAHGLLVLWSADPDRVPEDGLALLRRGDFRRLAIANPRVAPYGVAAQALLQQAGIELTRRQLVTGQSLGQAFNFVTSGNAELGLVAASQVIAYERENPPGSGWMPAPDSYPRIVQEVVRLSSARQPQAAQAFLDWVRTDSEAHRIMEADGYELPSR